MAPKKSSKTTPTTTAAALNLSDSTTELVFEKGVTREYVKSTLSDNVLDNRKVSSMSERALVAVLALFAAIVRFKDLKTPDSVVFDEVHFGGFARKYILGNFFMDVHPPLAKLLFAAVGYLGGFKGDFEFAKIGDKFPTNVPYVLMREFSALMSVATVIMMYLTLRSTGCKPIVSFLTSSLLILESSNVTISRFILLDSPLIFFISASIYSYKKLDVSKPFSIGWFRSLISTGICMGLALSSKWVGLFTIAWIGVCTVINLWFAIGDLSVSSKQLVGQVIAKGSILLGIPAVLYLAFFAVHLNILTKEGDGGAFLSSAFRTTFTDTTVPKSTYADVGVSSLITIRHLNTNGGYLHSHDHLYEGGSGQQQITLYPHLDDNNKWFVELYNVTEEPLEFVPILDGTKIRLRHMITSRRLHSHDVRPAVTEIEWQNEASCYGYEGFEGDANDDFIVEIVKSLSTTGPAQERVKAMNTVFRLRHAMTGCYLFSHETKLPKWGFEQQEVTCATQGIQPLSLWYVEQNNNIYLDMDNAEIATYPKMTFMQKVKELHQRMWKINNGLTASHVYESRPESWPLLTRGISYWRADGHQVYLLGNPLVWWIASFIFLPFSIYAGVQILRWQFGSTAVDNSVVFNYNLNMFEFVLGWFVHYYPSFLMDRQLFLHHYIPALYFGILALGQTLEVLHSHVFKNRKYLSYAMFGLLFAGSAFMFLERSPLIYASDWDRAKCEESKLAAGWDYDCNIYPESSLSSPTFEAPQVTQQPIIDFDQAIKLDLQQQHEKQLKIEVVPVVSAEDPVVEETPEVEEVVEPSFVEETIPAEVEDSDLNSTTEESSTVAEVDVEQLKTEDSDEPKKEADDQIPLRDEL
ncbi:glycosyltransferase family 39 protein [[Candida] arabinofermentans NRRL YB-2248]|uniref:Dolichyl-phosphate-mannose--protein mannosyltransferase n=1 Tax=[Candida] arabinofermentans NRRL YB-2248 TaxID=983967 RepID=A0A1E4T8R2_9ASCO|nr:glycosyltransferase family 39 protein [[Candida] arabinofermentans NRRL YB-2248]